MPRRPAFQPTKIKKRRLPWLVNIPPSLSETGKRQQRFYATRREAQTAADQLKIRKDNFGASLASLSAARLAEAAEAYDLLEPHRLGLLDVVREYLETHKERAASLPFGELFRLYIQSREGRSSKRYLEQLEWACDSLKSLHGVLASDITVRDLDAAFAGEKPTVKNAFMRYVRAVLNWGLKRDYLSKNPIEKMDFERVTKGETKIFEPAVVQAILNDCLENDLELLPFRVIGFFCGVRPDGELPRLEWSDIDMDAKQVTLRAEITKKRRKRWVDLSDNALAWLKEYRARGGRMAGKVVPFSSHELREHTRENWARAVGVTKEGKSGKSGKPKPKPKKPWIQQGMRHSFCSYWLVANGNDVDTLVVQSGHESKEVLWNHYYAAATKSAATEFWAIKPSRVAAENVIAFTN